MKKTRSANKALARRKASSRKNLQPPLRIQGKTLAPAAEVVTRSLVELWEARLRAT